MYIIIILFFTSLTGIIIMIGRKLAVVKGQTEDFEYSHPLGNDIQKIKYSLHRSARRALYIALVVALRIQLKSSKFIKENYNNLKFKVKNKLMKEPSAENGMEGQETSGFLKMISDYKHKVRKIKHKIKREEEN